MSDLNVNLNIPFDWEKIEKSVIKGVVKNISKNCEHLIYNLSIEDAKNYRESDKLDKSVSIGMVSVAGYIVDQYFEKHQEEIIERAVNQAVDKLMKRKAFNDRVAELIAAKFEEGKND